MYCREVVFPADANAERARWVAIYRRQVEVWDQGDPEGAERLRRGPYPRAVYCHEAARRFPSVRTAARYAGTTRSQMRTAILRNGGRVANLTFEYVQAAHQRSRTGGERRVRCVSDGVVFDSLREARHHGGVASSTLCGALRAAPKGQPAHCGGKLWEYVELDPTPQPTPSTPKCDGPLTTRAGSGGQSTLGLVGRDEPAPNVAPPRAPRAPRPAGLDPLYRWN